MLLRSMIGIHWRMNFRFRQRLVMIASSPSLQHMNHGDNFTSLIHIMTNSRHLNGSLFSLMKLGTSSLCWPQTSSEFKAPTAIHLHFDNIKEHEVDPGDGHNGGSPSHNPDKWRLGQLLTLSVILGLLLMASSFAHYFVARDIFGVSVNELNTILYLQMSASPQFVIFSTRVPGPFYQKRPSFVFFMAIACIQTFRLFSCVYGVVAYPM